MANPVLDLFRTQQAQCPSGHRFSYIEKRCVPDEFGLISETAPMIGAIDSLQAGYTPAVVTPEPAKKESETKDDGGAAAAAAAAANTKKEIPKWQIALYVVGGIIVLWMLVTYLKTGKIKLPTKLTLKRPELPTIQTMGGQLGGIVLE